MPVRSVSQMDTASLQVYRTAIDAELKKRGTTSAQSKLCPFCGSNDLSLEISGSTIYVICYTCRANGPTHDDDCEIQLPWDKWNTRSELVNHKDKLPIQHDPVKYDLKISQSPPNLTASNLTPPPPKK